MKTFKPGDKVLVNLSEEGEVPQWLPAVYRATLTDETVVRAMGRPHLVYMGDPAVDDQRKLPDERIKPIYLFCARWTWDGGTSIHLFRSDKDSWLDDDMELADILGLELFDPDDGDTLTVDRMDEGDLEIRWVPSP